MSHWYINGQLFDEKHPEWETLEPWPMTQAGTRCKRVGWEDRLKAGLKPSVTTWLSDVKGGALDGLMAFAAKIGRDVGYDMFCQFPEKDRDGEYAKKYFWRQYKERRDQYSKTGNKMHKAIEQNLLCKPMLIMSVPEARAAYNARVFLEKHNIIDGGVPELVVEGPDYAGRADWNHPGKQVLVDWKSIRDEPGRELRKPYPGELAQISAYWYAIFAVRSVRVEDTLPACNVYFSQRTGEILHAKWWTAEDLAKGFSLFKSAQCVTEEIRYIEAKL